MGNERSGSIRPAERGDMTAIEVAFGRAFADDPVWQWAITKRPIEGPAGRLLGLFARIHFPEGMVSVSTLPDGTVTGAAVWAPPGHWRIPAIAYLRYLPRLVSGLGIGGLSRIRAMEEVERRHPRDEHYYLAVVGVDPGHQGHGHGRALIEPVLERADAEGLPCFLESSKAENVPWYRGFGFDVTGEIRLPGGPPMWQMRREPR